MIKRLIQSVGDAQANRLHPEFTERFEQVKAQFFSRDPQRWPVFRDPGFQALIGFRGQHLHPDERLQRYPHGVALLDRLKTEDFIPTHSTSPDGSVDPLLLLSATLSKDWEHPSSVENVITQPCDPAIYGTMFGALANPNLVYSEYAAMAEEMERYVVRQIATLAGYDPLHATGLFTQGGTFCNLYGYLLGLRKCLPDAKDYGMGAVHDYRILNSQGGHYSNITNLSLLGVDVRKRCIRIGVTDNNEIDLADLERTLTACFELNCVVPGFMLTMGTTDTFGVDRIRPVVELRDRLCERFGIEVKPHIHVDSAIGWSILFFLDYDFQGNPLRINDITLEGIHRNVQRFHELRYADSFTVDFQKWGYVPYTSSLVMVRDRRDMKVLENDPENFSYFEKDLQGRTHLQFTIECSRGASGVFGAYMALQYMGIEGYQTVLAHCLQNANYFRHQLNRLGHVHIQSPENQGPSVSFRIYDPCQVSNPYVEFERERDATVDTRSQARLDENTRYHRQLFQQRGKVGLFTNWIESISYTRPDHRGHKIYIPGEKAVFMNPNCGRAQIDEFIDTIDQTHPPARPVATSCC